jgi:hypothetical protein
MTTKKQYMAIDQYGNTYHGLTHPRKDLMEKLYCKHVSKMYIDSKDGSKTYQTGYVIGSYWLNIYEVIPMRKEV